MPSWFLRGLRRGVVTTRYPTRPDQSAADLPTPPRFRAGWISRDSAERLAVICPSRALRREGDVLVFDVGACTCCGRCEQAEPAAVTPSGQFELAVTARDRLVKRIPLRPEVRP